MIKNEFVSVIIPCYNYANFISDAVVSVLSQTYLNLECIIIDDGSIDDTRSVVDVWVERDSRVKYYYQSNKGLAAARNAGLRIAKGQFVQFLDADDILEREKLANHVLFLKENSFCDLVYGDWAYFDFIASDGMVNAVVPKISPIKSQISGQGEQLLACFVRANAMVVSAPLVRRSLIDRCGEFDEGLAVYEDWDFWLRCICVGGHFEYFSPTGSATLIREHSNSLSKDILKMVDTSVIMRNRIEKMVINHNIAAINSRLLLESMLYLSLLNFQKGRLWDGCRVLLACLMRQDGLRVMFCTVKSKVVKFAIKL